MDMYFLLLNSKIMKRTQEIIYIHVFKYFELKRRKHHRKVETLFTAVFKALLEKNETRNYF